MPANKYNIKSERLRRAEKGYGQRGQKIMAAQAAGEAMKREKAAKANRAAQTKGKVSKVRASEVATNRMKGQQASNKIAELQAKLKNSEGKSSVYKDQLKKRIRSLKQGM